MDVHVSELSAVLMTGRVISAELSITLIDDIGCINKFKMQRKISKQGRCD